LRSLPAHQRYRPCDGEAVCERRRVRLHYESQGAGAGCSGQGNRKKRQRSARDVSNLADLDRLFGRIGKEKGKLDVVFANAGIAKYAPFGKITEEFYDSIFNINVKGLFFTVQKALPLPRWCLNSSSMRRSRGARDCPRIAFIAPKKPRYVRSPEPGQRISRIGAFA